MGGIVFGVGVSTDADVFQAGREAARQVIAQLGTRAPNVLLVFSSIRFADKKLLKGIRSETGEVPLVGCTDSGGISVSGPQRRAVTVVGLSGTGVTFEAGIARGVSQNARAAGKRLAETIGAGVRDPRLLLVFPDGLTASGSAIVEGLEDGLPSGVPIVGGSAADDYFFQRTFQYFNEEVVTDSVPGVLIGGQATVSVGVRHGWMPIGRPRRVTRAQGPILYQLDRRPAVSIYEDYLGIRKEELVEESLAHIAIAYPLGTAVPGQKEYLLRDAIRVGKEGSLICTGDVPEGSDVRLMIGGYESALEAAQEASHEAIEQLGGRKAAGALVFCSIARQKMLGSEFHGEIDVIRNSLGGAGVRMAGFYSAGEFAPASRRRGRRSFGPNTFHNESVVVLTLA